MFGLVGQGRPSPRERRASHHLTASEQLTNPAWNAPVPLLVGRTGVDLEFIVADDAVDIGAELVATVEKSPGYTSRLIS